MSSDDYEIRETVKRTVTELVSVLKNVYSNERVGLKEKCTLNLLGTKSFDLLLNAEISEKHKEELIIPMADVIRETKFLKEVSENKDLNDYWPTEYVFGNDEDVIRQAVKELNFNCI